MPILLYIPHLDGYILIHPLLDKIEWWGSFLILWNIFLIIIPSSSNLLTGRCAKTVHILHVSRTCSFSLYSTVRQIFCSCIHRQWLEWKLQPVKMESGKTLFIALTTAASKSSFINLVTRKNTSSSAELTKNDLLFLFYSLKVPTELSMRRAFETYI